MAKSPRQRLVDSKNAFMSASHRADFLNPKKTTDELIAQAIYLLEQGNKIQFTAVNSDHSIRLTPHSHTSGRAFDCWPLNSQTRDDFAPAISARMAKFLSDIARSKYTHAIGLGGAAKCAQNFACIDEFGFDDNDEDHIHIQVLTADELRVSH